MDPRILAAISKAVKDEMTKVDDRLKKIDTTLLDLLKLQKRVDD